jgi:hypothetical protein
MLTPEPSDERDDAQELHLVRELLRIIGETARDQRKEAKQALPDLAAHRIEALVVVLETMQVSLDELYE